MWQIDLADMGVTPDDLWPEPEDGELEAPEYIEEPDQEPDEQEILL